MAGLIIVLLLSLSVSTRYRTNGSKVRSNCIAEAIQPRRQSGSRKHQGLLNDQSGCGPYCGTGVSPRRLMSDRMLSFWRHPKMASTQGLRMTDSDIRAALSQHWAASDANDFELEHKIYQEDAVLEYPQSGEWIRRTVG